MDNSNFEGQNFDRSTQQVSDARQQLDFLERKVSLAGRRALGKRWDTHWRRLSARVLIESWNEILDKVGVCRFIEIGAHAAESSIGFASRGGEAIAFEVNPEVYRSLTVKARAFGVDTRHCAVTATRGFMDLRIPLSMNDDQSLPQDASLLDRSLVSDYSVATVPTITLNDVFREFDKDLLTALWIDAEGTTFDVLSGGHKALASGSIALIFAELESTAMWENQHTAQEVTRYLLDLNFHPIIRDSEKATQFNCIFVQTEYLEPCNEIAANYWVMISRLGLSSFKLYIKHGVRSRITSRFQ